MAGFAGELHLRGLGFDEKFVGQQLTAEHKRWLQDETNDMGQFMELYCEIHNVHTVQLSDIMPYVRKAYDLISDHMWITEMFKTKTKWEERELGYIVVLLRRYQDDTWVEGLHNDSTPCGRYLSQRLRRFIVMPWNKTIKNNKKSQKDLTITANEAIMIV